MARKINTNFRLGLNRQQLIEAAQLYGKAEQSAKKSNTKNLENYIVRQIAGKRTPFPDLTPKEKREVATYANEFNTRNALNRLTYRMEKLSGERDEHNFLRLTIAEGFSLYYDGQVRREHIDELISRLPRMGQTQVDSDMINISSYYEMLFTDYAEELSSETDAI